MLRCVYDDDLDLETGKGTQRFDGESAVDFKEGDTVLMKEDALRSAYKVGMNDANVGND